ncbi:zf-TFIIB domain-containing protein [Candidatus Binatia bacterium]|nr:zf-TFIIB domain-containing protein [Candidatus Binatia bacterium]
MKCPRCPESVLEEREREGVTVDACRTCYGVWLDRGELERLVARARDEIEALERRDRAPRPPEQRHEPGYAPQPYEHRRERWDDDDRYRHGRYGHKRKRWFEALGDIFD